MYKVVVSKNSVQIPAVIDSDDDNDEVRNLRVTKIYEKEKEEKMKIKFPEIDYAHISVDVMGSYTAIGDNSGNIKVSKIHTFQDAVDTLDTKLSTIKSNVSLLDSTVLAFKDDLINADKKTETDFSAFKTEFSTFKTETRDTIISYQTETDDSVLHFKKIIDGYQEDLDREKLKTSNLQERILVMEQAYHALLERVSELENN
jgi:autonomous glycyl radical cofactor GrcA